MAAPVDCRSAAGNHPLGLGLGWAQDSVLAVAASKREAAQAGTPAHCNLVLGDRPELEPPEVPHTSVLGDRPEPEPLAAPHKWGPGDKPELERPEAPRKWALDDRPEPEQPEVLRRWALGDRPGRGCHRPEAPRKWELGDRPGRGCHSSEARHTLHRRSLGLRRLEHRSRDCRSQDAPSGHGSKRHRRNVGPGKCSRAAPSGSSRAPRTTSYSTPSDPEPRPCRNRS